MCANGNEADPDSIDNCATQTTTVVASDLIPTALTVTSSGTNLLINDSVKNQGGATAGAFDVSFYLSADAVYQAGDTLVCKRTITSLPANTSNPASGTTQTSCAIPAAASAGMYYLISRVDSGVTVVEGNEANNDLATATTLGIGPDLTPTAMTAAKSGTTKVLVTETAKNQGNRNISGVTVTMRYYLSTDMAYGTGDIALASSSNGTGTCNRTFTTLNAGASSSTSKKTCYKPTGTTAGINYYVIVVDDALNTVVESAEGNNGRATTGTIKW
jgi:subtilase family serine protease